MKIDKIRDLLDAAGKSTPCEIGLRHNASLSIFCISISSRERKKTKMKRIHARYGAWQSARRRRN